MEKNKLKKIFAGIGLCSMMTAGAFMTTGCTNIDLSQEQVDKIMTVVDNSDKFMSGSLELLEDNNKIADIDRVVKLYELAKGKLILNYDNVWDNLKLSMQTEFSDPEWKSSNQKTEHRIMTMSDGVRVLEVYMVRDDGNLELNSSYTDVYAEPKPGEIVSLNTFDNVISSSFSDLMNISKITKDSIVDYEELENGNYGIISIGIGNVGGDTADQEILVECELTKDARLVSLTFNYIQYISNSLRASIARSKLTFEYDVLTADDFQYQVTE